MWRRDSIIEKSPCEFTEDKANLNSLENAKACHSMKWFTFYPKSFILYCITISTTTYNIRLKLDLTCSKISNKLLK